MIVLFQSVFALKKSNPITVTLNLTESNIGDSGTIGLSKNISWTNLTTLDLRGNNIGVKGATGLNENTSWKNLTTLDLSCNNIGDKG